MRVVYNKRGRHDKKRKQRETASIDTFIFCVDKNNSDDNNKKKP